jgi:hypothetical protein
MKKSKRAILDVPSLLRGLEVLRRGEEAARREPAFE